MSSKATSDADPDADHAIPAINAPTNAIFKIKDAKLYVPVVTQDDNKCFKQIKTGFKRTMRWDKYR